MSEEVNYKKNFCLKYFGKDGWDLDVLNEVDVLLKGKKGKPLLYIESKDVITSEFNKRKALAQTVLTDKKQDNPLAHIALIFNDGKGDDFLYLIDCSDDSVLYNNDINWKAEKPSSPSRDAIDRINDRLHGKITVYRNDEIKTLYQQLKNGKSTVIDITENNFSVVYNEWKSNVRFVETIGDEQDLINLFLVDMLNGEKYHKTVEKEVVTEVDLFQKKTEIKNVATEEDLICDGTNLNEYGYFYNREGKAEGIIYTNKVRNATTAYKFADSESYDDFWKKYKRPPEQNEFVKHILERSAMLYSDKYRRDTGGEYTPHCFVRKQNEILAQHYDMNEFVVFDPCAGVGNLENQFGKDFKQYCYLSTLEQMDVDTCKIKGFENTVRFDFLESDAFPRFKYKGVEQDIDEIARLEKRKLMIVMNPPYQRKKGFKNDLAIEFFNKCVKLQPDVIVYYCKTEFFLRDTIGNYVKTGYKIKSHIFSNAKDTFHLSEWSVSQVIFDKNEGENLNCEKIRASRYEINSTNDALVYKNTYMYDNSRPNLITEIERCIVENAQGMIIGQWCYLNSVLKISNDDNRHGNKITTKNLKYCLLSKGLNFNTHHKYFEWNYLVYRGHIDDISEELFNDAIMFSLFYKGFLFSNKGQRNYLMPFTSEQLGCAKNDLNVKLPDDSKRDLFSDNNEEESEFDFREWLSQFDFSIEAKDLFDAALKIFKYYHKNYPNHDWNDSYYDIANAIMEKDISSFQIPNEDKRRLYRVKTTKGTKGFGRNTIKEFVPSEYLPIFDDFFDKRDVLARKINRELLDEGLLLWERGNIY